MTKKVLIFLGWQSCSLLLEICSDKYIFVHKYQWTLDQPATVQAYHVTWKFYGCYPSTCIQFDGLKLHLNVYQVNFFGRNIFSTWANFPGQSIAEAWTCVLLQHISKLSMLDHNLSFPHKFTLGIFRRQFPCFCLLSFYFIRFWIIKTELFACTILSWILFIKVDQLNI